MRSNRDMVEGLTEVGGIAVEGSVRFVCDSRGCVKVCVMQLHIFVTC